MVPSIIEQAIFDSVQAHLHARNPKVTPARITSGPTLLTGICFCADCGGAMTLRTGKGGRYRYYTCSIKARQGSTGCKGRSIPMDKLDDIVARHLEDRLLDPERLEEILASLLDRRQERVLRRKEHVAELSKRAAETELRLKRLYDAIESGIADLDDPALKDRIAALKAVRDQAQADAGRATGHPGRRRHRYHTGSAQRLCQRRQGAHPPAQWWIPPRPSTRPRTACRGRGGRGSHHGIEERSAEDSHRSGGRKTGYAGRSQFGTEMADREGFEPTRPSRVCRFSRPVP